MSASGSLPTGEIIRAFSFRLRLARSAELALAGSLLRAEELITPNGGLPETAEELDLLARILVRQKRYAEAEKRWKDALRVSGGKNCYQDALDSLNAYVIALQHRKQIVFLSVSILSLILTMVWAIFVIR
jgi:hypothetical protein